MLQNYLNSAKRSVGIAMSAADPSLPPSVEDPQTPPQGIGSDLIPKSQWELIQLCVHVTRLLAIPRSVREIFGFVFSSPSPVTFDDIVASLGISSGSASHGLRYLRRIGALSVTYVVRDRRDYFVAETSLARLFSGYLIENLTHHLADSRERIAAMRHVLESGNDLKAAHLSTRVEVLLEWNRQVSTAISAASETLNPPCATGR